MKSSIPVMRLHGIMFRMNYEKVIGYGLVAYIIRIEHKTRRLAVPRNKGLAEIAAEFNLTRFKGTERSKITNDAGGESWNIGVAFEAPTSPLHRAAFLAALCVKTELHKKPTSRRT